MSLVQAKCTNCGANIEVDPKKEAGICPYCNTAYITQKAIVNYNTTIINNTTIQAGTVNVISGNFDNLMKIAKEAWEGADYSDAYEKFSKALEINPDSEDALLYKSLCAGWNDSNFKIIKNAFCNVFNKVDFKTASNEKIENLNYFLNKLYDFIMAYNKITWKLYDPNYYNNENIKSTWTRIENEIVTLSMIIDFQNKIKDKSNVYKNNYLTYLKTIFSLYKSMCDKWTYDTHKTGGLIDIRREYHPNKEEYQEKKDKILEKIKQYDPNFQPPEKQGCYIATAVYGSYDCAPVWVLRRYRDYKLGQTFWGRAFIKIYYSISPTLVRFFGKKKYFQKFWKNRLNNLVEKLKKEGFEDTPYQDRNWK